MTWGEERRSRRVLRAMERDARRAARPRRSLLPGLAVLGALSLAAFAVGVRTLDLDLTDPTDLGALFRPRVYVEVDGEAIAVPRPAPASGRVLSQVEVTTDGRYAFLRTDDDGDPIGYDPCRPVAWVMAADSAPPGGTRLVEQAVQAISEATGLRFEYQGVTDERADLDRPIIQPERYGQDWAPVLVAWATDAEVPELGGDVAGIGGSAAVPGVDGSGQWLAAGRLILDSDDLGFMIDQGDTGSARAVIMHELAHVVGLDHVDDDTELMNPMTSKTITFGPGDRAGLAVVGAVDCQE